VCPSGLAFATISEPMLPEAPDRLSTTKFWLYCNRKLSAKSRASKSVEPPVAHGTMMRTVDCGYAVEAHVIGQKTVKSTVSQKEFLNINGAR
jgi:hypothetical protein